jgi:type II secretory pathway pseudopilin PulG
MNYEDAIMSGIKTSYQSGVGLLELLLSLAIIAIILIMTTRYYTVSSASQKVNAAVEMVNQVKVAMDKTLATVPAGSVPTELPTIVLLVQQGLLPASYVSTLEGDKSSSRTNPWNESISIGAVSAATYQIVLVTPTSDTCSLVAKQINITSGNTVDSPPALCVGGILTATFYR